jgi:hypothetical protein
VDLLEEQDFEEESNGNPEIFGTQTRYHVLYCIEMAKLCILCGSVSACPASEVLTYHSGQDINDAIQPEEEKQRIRS